MTIRVTPNSKTSNIRLCVSNDSGYYLDICLYKEAVDPKTGIVSAMDGIFFILLLSIYVSSSEIIFKCRSIRVSRGGVNGSYKGDTLSY